MTTQEFHKMVKTASQLNALVIMLLKQMDNVELVFKVKLLIRLAEDV